MNLVTLFLSAVLCFGQGNEYINDQINLAQIQYMSQKPLQNVHYDLPDGWTRRVPGDEDYDITDLTAYEGSPDFNATRGSTPKLIISLGGQDTKEHIQKTIYAEYQENKKQCDELANSNYACPFKPEYKELTIAGLKVYASMNYSIGEGGGWITSFVSIKNGQNIGGILYGTGDNGRIDNQLSVFEHILSTFTWDK